MDIKAGGENDCFESVHRFRFGFDREQALFLTFDEGELQTGACKNAWNQFVGIGIGNVDLDRVALLNDSFERSQPVFSAGMIAAQKEGDKRECKKRDKIFHNDSSFEEAEIIF